MSLFGAVEDGRRIRLPNVTGRLALDVANVTFTGTGSIQFPNFDKVLFASVEQVIGTSPGVGPSVFTYTIDGTTANKVDLFAWQPTSSTNPTLIAGTSAATVTVVVFGVRRQGQSI